MIPKPVRARTSRSGTIGRMLGTRSLRWLVLGGLALASLALPRWLLGWRYQSVIFKPDQTPPQPVAIVFGAGLWRDRPSRVLADRVAAAADLYHRGLVDRLLMSGTARTDGYDEPAAMKALAIDLGVPDHAILTDGGGSRTYETCRRAQQVFGIEAATLVTQRYHLPRALVTCESLGVTSVGASADLRRYSSRAYRFWELREIPATLVALWESVLRPRLAALPLRLRT